jgi:hypothetical protein
VTIAILDSNIYDRLSKDTETVTVIRAKIEGAKLKILMPRAISEELWLSPFQGIPKLFPVEFSGNTVGLCGIAACGDSIGSGTIFKKHLGQSKQMKDALIADAADWKAQWLVSEDKRLRRRMAEISTRCNVLNYAEFREELHKLT